MSSKENFDKKKSKSKTLFNPFDSITISLSSTLSLNFNLQDISSQLQLIYRKIRKNDTKTKIKGFEELEEWLNLCNDHKDFLDNFSPIFPLIYNQSSTNPERLVREISQKILFSVVTTKDKKWIIPFISDIIYSWIGSFNDPFSSVKTLSKQSFEFCFPNPSKIIIKYGIELETKALSSLSMFTNNTTTKKISGGGDDDEFEEILTIVQSLSVLEFLNFSDIYKEKIPLCSIIDLLRKKPSPSSIIINISSYRILISSFNELPPPPPLMKENHFFEILIRDLQSDTLASYSAIILKKTKFSSINLEIFIKNVPLIIEKRSDISIEFMKWLMSYFEDVEIFMRIVLHCITSFKSYDNEKLKVLTKTFLYCIDNSPNIPLLMEYTQHLVKSELDGFSSFRDEVIPTISEESLLTMIPIIEMSKKVRNEFIISLPRSDSFLKIVIDLLENMDLDDLDEITTTTSTTTISISSSSTTSPWDDLCSKEYLLRQISLPHPIDCDKFIHLFKGSSLSLQNELLKASNFECLNILCLNGIHVNQLENRCALLREFCSLPSPSQYFLLLLEILDVCNVRRPQWGDGDVIPSDDFIKCLSLEDSLEKGFEKYHLSIIYACHGVQYQTEISDKDLAKFIFSTIIDPIQIIEMLPISSLFNELFILYWIPSLEGEIIKHCSLSSPSILHCPLLLNENPSFSFFKTNTAIKIVSRIFIDIYNSEDLLPSFIHLIILHLTLLEEGHGEEDSLEIKDVFYKNISIFSNYLDNCVSSHGGMYLFFKKKLTFASINENNDLSINEVVNYSFSELYLISDGSKNLIGDLEGLNDDQLIKLMIINNDNNRSLFFEIFSNIDVRNISSLSSRSLMIFLEFLLKNVKFINSDFLVSSTFEDILRELLESSFKKGPFLWKSCFELMVKLLNSKVIMEFESILRDDFLFSNVSLGPFYHFLYFLAFGFVGTFWKNIEISFFQKIITESGIDTSHKMLCCMIMKDRIDQTLLQLNTKKNVGKEDVGGCLLDLAILRDFSMPSSDLSNNFLTFLTLMDVFISLAEGSQGDGGKISSLYGEYLSDCGYLQNIIVKFSSLIGWINDHHKHNCNHNLDDKILPKMDSFIYFEFSPETFTLKDYSIYIFYRFIKRFPSTIRKHFIFSFSHPEKEKIMLRIREIFSPSLIDREILRLKRYSDNCNNDESNSNLESKIVISIERSSTRCLILISYELEETKVSMRWCINDSYPLIGLELENDGKSLIKGKTDGKMRNWLMLARSILHQSITDMNVLEMIFKWKETIDHATKGESACPICYYVLHPQDKSTPSSRCSTCKNKFHPICIYKWFKSGQNTCPMCRSIM